MKLERASADKRALSRKERVGLTLHRALDRWLTPLGVWVMRRTRGGMADSRLVRMIGAPRELHVLLLTTRGRRSGRQRTVVLQYFPDGAAMVVAAANDGGASHPGWYFNLAGCPEASVELAGRIVPVIASEMPPDEALRWWTRILERDPSYERYARATTRRIPILRLTPSLPIDAR